MEKSSQPINSFGNCVSPPAADKRPTLPTTSSGLLDQLIFEIRLAVALTLMRFSALLALCAAWLMTTGPVG